MRLPHVRFTIRSLRVTVAVAAGLLAVSVASLALGRVLLAESHGRSHAPAGVSRLPSPGSIGIRRCGHLD